MKKLTICGVTLIQVEELDDIWSYVTRDDFSQDSGLVNPDRVKKAYCDNHSDEFLQLGKVVDPNEGVVYTENQMKVYRNGDLIGFDVKGQAYYVPQDKAKIYRVNNRK